MMTPEEYRRLSESYQQAAAAAKDQLSSDQLRLLADSYMTLTRSTEVLNRSGRLLATLEQEKKKVSRSGT